MIRSVLLVCQANGELGIGHLTRMTALAGAIARSGGNGPRLLVQGARVDRADLPDETRFVVMEADLLQEVEAERSGAHTIVLDLHAQHFPLRLESRIEEWRREGVRVVGVDALLRLCEVLDAVWVPSVLVTPDELEACPRIEYGWNSFLLAPAPARREWEPGDTVLVATGGSDVTGLAETLPASLDAALGRQLLVDWVQGPFATDPMLPESPRLGWSVHKAPSGLGPLMQSATYGLTVFGVTLFEMLQAGIPTVVFSSHPDREVPELEIVAEAGAAVVAADAASAVAALAELVVDDDAARTLSATASGLMSVNGADRLAALIHSLDQ